MSDLELGSGSGVTWIVATHDLHRLREVLLDGLHLTGDDQLLVEPHAPSIAVAYNRATTRARNRVRCYVHHDTRLLDPHRLRELLLATCTEQVGMVGVIGSRTPVVPWWEGQRCGSVIDTRPGFGLLDFGPGGHECAYLDGLLLATSQPVTWDESLPGWHLYDHDICQQMRARGLPNWCLPRGHELVRHETCGPADISRLTGWDENVARFHSKWPDLQ